jgi:murein DD-endopeptidase MepM/ murein hydrolase activator NlpD
MDTLSSISSPVSGPKPADASRTASERQMIVELAQEFESMMLLQMLKQMRQAMADDETREDGLSASTMLDTVDSELARQLSRAGGFGLARMMIPAIAQRDVPPELPAEAASDHLPGRPAASERPAVQPAPSLPVADTEAMRLDLGATARVTSAFGWRTDPLTATQRFHGGIDLGAPYGQSVPAAANGRVVEVGDQGNYGTTVVIDHGSGVRTRYAHLSAVTVAVGDQVGQSQEIGRIGQSGRATGPHLHFEVTRDGRRIDPAAVMAYRGRGQGGLKLVDRDADSPISRRPLSPAISGADDEDRGH